MSILGEDVRKQVKEILSNMEDKVELVYFYPQQGCRFCEQIEALVDEIAELSGNKVVAKKFSFEDKEKASLYNADNAPLLLIKGKNKGEIRFYGIPSGHEFGAFLATLIDASKGNSEDLPEELKKEVVEMDKPLHIKVFVTPTCPYCPISARLSYLLALINEKIRADVYEAIEFPDLATMYNVRGVPKTIVNERMQVEGALPADLFIKKIKKEFFE